MSWWPAEGDASDVEDGNDGALQNGAGADAAGLVGGAFTFDGVDDFVEVPRAPNLDITGSLTLIAWVNLRVFPGTTPSVINKGNVGNYDESYALFVNPDRSAALLLNSGRYPTRPDLNRLIIGGGPLTAGVWHLIAGTFDEASGEVRFYLDGRVHGFLPVWYDGSSLNRIRVSTAPVLIGKAERAGTPYSSGYLDGHVDEPQVYNRALSEAEILAIYTAGAAGFCRDGPAAPVAAAGGPYAGAEGSAIPFDGSRSSDPAGGALTYAWDFGDGTTGSGATPSHAYGDNGEYAISLTVTAANGLSSATTTTATVVNLNPALDAITAPVDPQQVGTPIMASVAFRDAGTLDTHAATVDWDAEGSSVVSAGTVSGSGESGMVAASHAYASAGVYALRATVTDDDGGAGTADHQYVVVYDPTAGFVTGGGHITSPPGAYEPSPALAGRATFAFVSRYHKGAATPTGTTHFRFKVAGLEFASTSYQWLVVAGARAQFKGAGSINGTGTYGFMLTAIDGALAGAGGPDRFRIRIWDLPSGSVVYDNQMGAADGADPATAIDGGAIVIHR